MGYIGEADLWATQNRVSAPEVQSVADTSPAITHLGATVCITTATPYQGEAVMIPLRNGFPLYANDRTSPVFCLLTDDGCRAGHVIKIKDFGLRVHFDGLAGPGHYFIDNNSPVGQA